MSKENKNKDYNQYKNKSIHDNDKNHFKYIQNSDDNKNTDILDKQMYSRMGVQNPYDTYQDGTNTPMDTIPNTPNTLEYNPHPGYIPKPSITFKSAFNSSIVYGSFWIILCICEIISVVFTFIVPITALIITTVVFITLTIILTVVFWMKLTDKWGDYLTFPMVLVLPIFFLGIIAGLIVILRVCVYRKNNPHYFKNGVRMIVYVEDKGNSVNL